MRIEREGGGREGKRERERERERSRSLMGGKDVYFIGMSWKTLERSFLLCLRLFKVFVLQKIRSSALSSKAVNSDRNTK